ncbi:hypothetical protein WS97_23405 [Burkholderia territorii]|uniref:hypothetical protein n=1 Tax=Burkholderia territorii TaxID=1503055 RepID=UPI0007559ECE|nr:hypothetical protein [Burkholderia territorii]KVL31130.1 hypothetical protein WS97_23405 [Burkholderia territorii]
MSRQRKGSNEDRTLSTTYLAESLWKGRGGQRENQNAIEESLSLYQGWIADHLGKRGMEEEDFVLKARLGYAQCRLDDQFVFEFGLWRLLDTELAKSEIEALLTKRHKANEIFRKGIDRMLRGRLPLPPSPKGGTPKRWDYVQLKDAHASYQAWVQQIEALGCLVMDVEEWLGWFYVAEPARTMEETMWYWGSDSLDGEVPCPPWASDRDYLETLMPLNSPKLLDRLILVTESDMPYSAYHSRFEHPSSRPRLKGCVITDEVTEFSVIDGELEPEPSSRGDDIEAWMIERRARMTQATRETNALIDRASRRKSGGACG